MAQDAERSVLERVTDVVQEVLKVDASKVSPTTDIRNDLGADSVDLLTFVLALEETFGGKVPDDEMMDIVTVQDAVDMIENRLVKSD